VAKAKKARADRSDGKRLAEAIDTVLSPRFTDATLAEDDTAFYCYDGQTDLELFLPVDEVRERVANGTLRQWLESIVPQREEAISALELAAGGGYLEVVRLLIDSGDEEAIAQSFGALAQAANRGDVDAVREQLAAGLPARRSRSTRGGRKRPASGLLLKTLGRAAQEGRVEVVRELLPLVSTPHRAKPSEYAALGRAAYGGHAEVVRLLLATIPGPPPEAISDALTAVVNGVQGAEQDEGFGVALDLLAPLASPPAVAEARSKLDAIRQGRRRTAEARPPAQDEATKELLRAAEKEHVEAVRRWLAAGADVNGRNKEGWTVLHVAIGETPDLVRLLIEAGAVVNARARKDGETPLLTAARRPGELGVQLVRLLVDAGADATARDDQGRNAIDIAEECGQFIPDLAYALVMIELVRLGTDCGTRSLETRLQELRECDRGDRRIQEQIDSALSGLRGP
jgi:ankyrin repeat protein